MIQKMNRPASIRRKRRVYRILMVIIGLVMIADLVNLFLSPARDFSNVDPSSMPALDENAQPPEGFSPPQGQFPQGQMPEGMSPPSGEAPEGFTPPSGEVPEGMTPPSGEAPEGFTPPSGETPEGFTPPSGQAPEGFTPPQDGNASRPDAGSFNPQRAGGPAGGLMGLSLMARRAWLPILIICLLAEAFCLYRLIQLKKQAALEAAKDGHQGPPAGEGPQMGDPKADESNGADTPDLQNDPDASLQENPSAHKKSDRILPLLLVLAVSAVIASLPSDQSKAKDLATNEKVLSTTAQAQTITSLLSGTGTLQDQKAQGITVPEGVILEAYHVNNGDLVSEGDLLATVDRASVGLAIEDLQAVIDDLDQDLEAAQDQSPSTKIRAAADGRVKAIYAEEGQAVLKTISDYQSLMVISLDGLMAVDLETDQDLAMGEEVKVVLSDGNQAEGQVSAKEEGKVTVTLSDQSAPMEDPVTLYRADGQELGQGTLYVHSPLKVTGYYGTTDSLHVQVNDKVEKGDRLISLTDAGSSDTYQNLLKRRKQLEDQMEDLSKIYQEGGILAPGEGIVSGIPQGSKIISLSQKDGDAGVQVKETASWIQKRVSAPAVMTFEGVQTSTMEQGMEIEGHLEPLTQASDPLPSQTQAESTTEDLSEASSETQSETEQASQDPSEPSTQAPSESATEAQSPVSTESQSEEGTQTASLVHYPAKVVSVDPSSVHFVLSTRPIQGASHKNLTGWTEGNFDYSLNYTCSATLSVDLHQNGKWEILSASDLVPGDLCLICFQNEALENQSPLWITAQREGNQTSIPGDQPGEMAAQGLSSTAPMQSMGSAPSSSSTQKSPSLSASSQTTSETAESKIYESYSLEEKTILSITAQEKMSLEVQVDELDILSLRQDMPVTITLEALKGQAFTGTLSQISASATNEGGNSKYKVTVTLPKSDNLIAGMNAAVKIQTDQKEDVMSLPVSALMEDGEKTYVYTQYDEKKNALGGLVEVETGLSDGDLVEIQSGLEKDTPVYYRYADTMIYTQFSSF